MKVRMQVRIWIAWKCVSRLQTNSLWVCGRIIKVPLFSFIMCHSKDILRNMKNIYFHNSLQIFNRPALIFILHKISHLGFLLNTCGFYYVVLCGY